MKFAQFYKSHLSQEYYEPDPEQVLPQLSCYLRYAHYYCVWCGVKYIDTTDMNSHCPGETQAQHDDSQQVDFADDTDFAD